MKTTQSEFGKKGAKIKAENRKASIISKAAQDTTQPTITSYFKSKTGPTGEDTRTDTFFNGNITITNSHVTVNVTKSVESPKDVAREIVKEGEKVYQTLD